MKMRSFFLLSAIFLAAELFAAKLPVVDPVETQPLAAQVKRLVTAMDLLGEPLDAKTKAALEKASKDEEGAVKLQRIMDVCAKAFGSQDPLWFQKVPWGSFHPTP